MPDQIERSLELRRQRDDSDIRTRTIDLGKDVGAIEDVARCLTVARRRTSRT